MRTREKLTFGNSSQIIFIIIVITIIVIIIIVVVVIIITTIAFSLMFPFSCFKLQDSPFSHRTDTKRSLCYWQACVRWFDGNCNILQDPRVVLYAEQRSDHPWGIIPGNVELVLVIYCPHYDSGTTLHASVVKLYNTQYILVNQDVR